MKTILTVLLFLTCIACNNHTDTIADKVITTIIKDSIRPKKDSVHVIKPQAEDPLPPEKYKATGDSIGWELWNIDGVGDIKIDMPKAKVLALLGTPDTKTKPEESWIDGATYQEWEYKEKGIYISMNLSDGKIGDFTISTPCTLKTKRRIGIGSSSKEVIAAYKKAIYNADGVNDGGCVTADLIIAGSVYGGIQFTIKDKKVTQIFFGATAE
jgi:hypothetical protein